MSEKIKLEVGKFYKPKSNPLEARKEILAMTDEWVVYNDRSNTTEGEGTIVRKMAEKLWEEIEARKSFMVYEMIDEEGSIYLGDEHGEELNFSSENQTGNGAPHLKLGRSWMYEPETNQLLFFADTNNSTAFADILKDSAPFVPSIPYPGFNPAIPGFIPGGPGFNPGEIICSSATNTDEELVLT